MHIFSVQNIAIGVVAAMVLAGALYATYPTATKPPAISAEPRTEVVLFSGVVEPQERVTLAFEKAGRLAEVRYHRSDAVSRGVPLAYLVSTTAQAELAQQEALLQTELAQLDILVRGATAEEIALERAKVAQAEKTTHTATRNLETAIINAFTVSDNAVYNVSDELFDNPRSHVPKLLYTVTNSGLVNRIENDRLMLEQLFSTWSTEVAPFVSQRVEQKLSRNRVLFANAVSATTPASTQTVQATQAESSRSSTLAVRAFLEDVAAYTALLDAGTSGASAANITAWRNNVSTARTAVQSALATLDSALNSFLSAQEALRVAEASLARIQAPATAEDIKLQEAKVAAQRARILASEAALAQYTLRAPANGTVIEKHKNTGELVTVGEAVYTIDTGSVYEIQGRVSELDVVRLAKNMNATVTFDALDEQSFAAVITHVDTAERAIGNDEGYGITLRLVHNDAPIKAGMTADVQVALYE